MQRPGHVVTALWATHSLDGTAEGFIGDCLVFTSCNEVVTDSQFKTSAPPDAPVLESWETFHNEFHGMQNLVICGTGQWSKIKDFAVSSQDCIPYMSGGYNIFTFGMQHIYDTMQKKADQIHFHSGPTNERILVCGIFGILEYFHAIKALSVVYHNIAGTIAASKDTAGAYNPEHYPDIGLKTFSVPVNPAPLPKPDFMSNLTHEQREKEFKRKLENNPELNTYVDVTLPQSVRMSSFNALNNPAGAEIINPADFITCKVKTRLAIDLPPNHQPYQQISVETSFCYPGEVQGPIEKMFILEVQGQEAIYAQVPAPIPRLNAESCWLCIGRGQQIYFSVYDGRISPKVQIAWQRWRQCAATWIDGEERGAFQHERN